MPKPSTVALVNKILNPSVQTPAAFRDALVAFMPKLSGTSQQAAVLQGLASVAEIEEDDVSITQKMVGFRMSLASIQQKHDRVLDMVTSLQRAVDAYEFEAAELDRVVNRPNDPPADPNPPLSGR